MKKFKRLMCVFISMVFVFSMFGTDASAAAYPRLNKTSLIMLVGSAATLKVTGAGGTVKWSSTNTSVCTVSKSGRVRAKGPGTAKICARTGGRKLYCRIQVVKSYISSISPKTMNKGESMSLSLKAYNVYSVNAYSSDSGIVRVTDSYVYDGNINVTLEAVSAGTAYINISDRNNSSAYTSAAITVTAPPEPSPDTDDDTVSIRIRAVDNGDGTLRFIISTVDEKELNNPGAAADYAEEMLKLVNEERAKVGSPALVLNDELCKAAQVRAKELGESFSHTRPDGRECFTVLENYNVSCVYASENIAYGASTSEGAMKLWMNSSGHRANLLSSNWRKMGVGYDSSTGSWVQIFTD